MKPRTTTAKGGTIYRPCPCGETAHDLMVCPAALVPEAPAVAVNEWGNVWIYKCRNCRARIYRTTRGAA
jgi:hypothetical protein